MIHNVWISVAGVLDQIWTMSDTLGVQYGPQHQLQPHYIHTQQLDQVFWTHQKLDLSKHVLEQYPAPQGHMMYNNLLEGGD